MSSLLKIVFTLAAFFASSFLLIRFSGLFTVEEVTVWLEQAHNIDAAFLCILVILLLFSDLFIAIPTLTISVLSGYFLGFALGSMAAFVGMLLAGIAGYLLSRRFGESILQKIVKSEAKRKEAVMSFEKYGVAMILLSRVSPILPEVSACMAGMTGMKLYKFLFLWCMNTFPYALIAAYSGSVSSLNNPKPAIYAAIGMYALLWTSWFILRQYKHSNQKL